MCNSKFYILHSSFFILTDNLGLGLLATLREWPRDRVQPSTVEVVKLNC
ncbi:hypothetical protein [Moorena producens]